MPPQAAEQEGELVSPPSRWWQCRSAADAAPGGTHRSQAASGNAIVLIRLWATAYLLSFATAAKWRPGDRDDEVRMHRPVRPLGFRGPLTWPLIAARRRRRPPTWKVELAPVSVDKAARWMVFRVLGRRGPCMVGIRPVPDLDASLSCRSRVTVRSRGGQQYRCSSRR